MIDSYFSAILLVIGLVLEWTPPPQNTYCQNIFILASNQYPTVILLNMGHSIQEWTI